MSRLLGNKPQDEAARQDDAIVDNYVRAHWPGVELANEAPAPAASASGQPDPSEDEQFDAYMRAFWPGRTPA